MPGWLDDTLSTEQGNRHCVYFCTPEVPWHENKNNDKKSRTMW